MLRYAVRWALRIATLTILIFGVGRFGSGVPADFREAMAARIVDLLPPSGPDEPAVDLPPVPRPDCATDPAVLLPPPLAPDGRRANYFHTCGNRIYDADGQIVRFTGVNWSGLETGDLARMGLGLRNWQSLLDQVATLGYNAIRLPLSNEVLRPTYRLRGADPTLNPDLVDLTGLEFLDLVVAGARARGLRIVLDRHWPTTAGPADSWHDWAVSEDQWIADWQMLARRYLGNDTVVGADLHNEPGFDAIWGSGDPAADWRLAAERAGNAVLAENPYLLIFVEGIARSGDDWYWQGGYLDDAGREPVRLQVPNRLVYSPHDYGPSVYAQGWFQAPDFPANLPAIWRRHWAYLHEQALAPVVIGEFGGPSVGADSDGRWQRSLLDYIRRHDLGFFVWSLNPSSSDTGGVLADDWQTVQPEKQAAYGALMARPLDHGTTTRLGAPRGRLRVDFRPLMVEATTRRLDFTLDLVNEGTESVPLRAIELRYWLTAGTLSPDEQDLLLEAEPDTPWAIEARLEPAAISGADSAISLRFAEDAAPLQPGQHTGPLRIQVARRDRSRYVQSNDYSFAPSAQPAWLRVTVHRENGLIWGLPPPGY